MAADHSLHHHEHSCPGDYTLQQLRMVRISVPAMLECSDELDIEACYPLGIASLYVRTHEILDSDDDFMRSLSKFGQKLGEL
jgi:hypothetical protein